MPHRHCVTLLAKLERHSGPDRNWISNRDILSDIRLRDILYTYNGHKALQDAIPQTSDRHVSSTKSFGFCCRFRTVAVSALTHVLHYSNQRHSVNMIQGHRLVVPMESGGEVSIA